jgi:hypothetical protein
MISAAGKTLASGGHGGRRNERWVVEALQAYPVAGQQVAVFGSMEPWYESLLLAAGAAAVTTIEYNLLTYGHPKITTVLPSGLGAVGTVPTGGACTMYSFGSLEMH